MPGILYIVATPIGNLGDLTPRVKQTFETVDLILAEDTRVTIKLLNHLGIKKRMISCHSFNEKSRLEIISKCGSLNEKVALVSDAGTPLISDPGNDIVHQAIECGMTIIPIPGPSAFLLALVASGLPCDRFVFEGFLPTKASLLKQRLENLKCEERTIIVYEAPHRLLKTLAAIKNILGDREICLAKELTKFYEKLLRDKLSNVIDKISHNTTDGTRTASKLKSKQSSNSKILGEYVLIIAGAQAMQKDNENLEAIIENMFQSGISLKTIVQHVTKTYKLKRSEVYQLALKVQEEQSVYASQD